MGILQSLFPHMLCPMWPGSSRARACRSFPHANEYVEPPAEVSRRLHINDPVVHDVSQSGPPSLPNPTGDDSADEQPEFNQEQLNVIIDMAGRDVACRANLPEHVFDDALAIFKESFEPDDGNYLIMRYSKSDVKRILALTAKWCAERAS